jgi:pyruvate/2-oxoglutarate dehydrogenase complex dihydrolipoamide dehydrogenase (E3) component
VADELFVAVGRRPRTTGLDLERAGIELDDRGAIRVSRRLATTARGVWAAGDVTGGLRFTHVADYQGRLVVRNALTPFSARAEYGAVPWVTFTDPEVARVGPTADQAEAAGLKPRVFRADFEQVEMRIAVVEPPYWAP